MNNSAQPGRAMRPHLAGLRTDLLLKIAADASADQIPWPEGFELIRLLGAGGMGEVYLARDLSLGREVAVKIIHPDFSGEPVFLERLAREARLMSSISHPGIVVVHRFEQLGSEGAAIIMEAINGGNLRQWMREQNGTVPVDEAVHIAREVAAAVHAGHKRGVIHRDLKPENILLTSDGRAKVTDFGLAAPTDPQTTRLTMTGTTAGTADYMAPERHISNEAKPEGDVYSLGVILYEMLTGALPRGNFDPPIAVRNEMPQTVSEAVMRSLKSNPSHRFASMEEFAIALQATPPFEVPRGSQVSRAVIPAAIVLALTGLVAGIMIAMRPSDSLDKPTIEVASQGREQAPRPLSPAVEPPPQPIVEPQEPPTSNTPSPGPWQDALAKVDVMRDDISGGWTNERGGVVSDNRICILKLSDQMPDSYDVRMTFTRVSGIHSIALFFQNDHGTGTIDIDGWGEHLAGVQTLDGRDLRHGNSFFFRLENGRTYELLVKIRPEEVSISIDGTDQITTPFANRTLGVAFPWAWNPIQRPAALAIGSYESPTQFTSVQWREVDGQP